MARNRASMREGPLAELFRATEAAKRGGHDDAHEQQELPTEPEPQAADPPEPTPLRVAEPARLPQQPEPTEPPEPAAVRPPTRWLDPLPESPARLERARVPEA